MFVSPSPYLWAQGKTDVMFSTGDLAPDGNGRLSSFFPPSMNDSGQTVFRSQLMDTALGTADDLGIFTGDGIDLIQVVRRGDLLWGSAIINLPQLGASVNRYGQVGYLATLANGNEIYTGWTLDLQIRIDKIC